MTVKLNLRHIKTNITNVSATVTFVQFNAPLLNKSTNHLNHWNHL